MKIAIIGAGNVGGALAKGWARAGHSVILGVRDPQSEKIKPLLASENISAQTTQSAANEVEILLIALPINAVVDVLKSLGNLQDKIIIDATNSVFQKPAPYATTFEAIKALTNCEHVVKCFNSTGFENMENPQYDETGIDMFIAGSSQRAKEKATQLAKELGFAECYDFGGDDKVPLLEQFAFSWINLAILQKYGRGIAFKVLKRQ